MQALRLECDKLITVIAVFTQLSNVRAYYSSKHMQHKLLYWCLIMPPPLTGIKRCFCRTSVVYIGPKSRTERPRRTKIGKQIAHVTCDSDTTFKVKRSSHQAALLSAALTRKAAAAVSVGMYSALESTATLRLLGSAEGLGARRGRRGAGTYCVATRTAC